MAGPSWKDLDVLGRRNNKIIKYMETLLFKVKKDDPDAIVHYAAAIGNITRQNIEIIKLVENIKEIDAWFSGLEKDKLAINKQRLRQMDKQNKEDKQEIQNQIEREKQEIHEEKVARRHSQEMKL